MHRITFKAQRVVRVLSQMMDLLGCMWLVAFPEDRIYSHFADATGFPFRTLHEV